LGIFEIGSCKLFAPGLALNCDPPDLCLLSSWDYRRDHQCPASDSILMLNCLLAFRSHSGLL
jgi:hypothetical protein